jgi:hypothetical protein
VTPEQKAVATAAMSRFAFKPASSEWLEALHVAQKDAKQIERTKGIPNNNGTIKYYVAQAEDFTNESRRCLHPHGMGWFRQSTKLAEVNPHTQAMVLTGCYVVYHAPSGQAQVFFAEWSARADGDAMAKAHTRMTRRFIQGLLQVAVVDEGSEPEDPPRNPPTGCQHPREAHTFGGDPVQGAGGWSSEVICTMCGSGLGWAPCAPPAPVPGPDPTGGAPLGGPGYAAQGQAPPPQQMFSGPPEGPRAPTMAQVPVPPTAPQQPPPPQQPAPMPMGAGSTNPGGVQAPLPPIENSLVLQQAQRELGATKITEQQMRKEMASPPENAAPVNPGDPSTPDAWRETFVARGMDGETALHVAMLDDAAVVELPLVDDMRNWAWAHFQGSIEEITKAWTSVGFEPVPGLPLADRPRPTGIQAKQFLAKMKFKTKVAPAAQ